MGSYFTDADIPQSLKNVFDRSTVALDVADLRQPDCPLVGINDGFCELTGYAPDEVLGRNCRFLQPDEGAGPVRERMRAFLEDDSVMDEKFVVPNVKSDGTPFLNLLYMSKLARGGEVSLVLGSQFAIGKKSANQSDIYDRALREDLRQLTELTSDTDWAVLGSVEALASSYSIIARARLD